MPPRVKLGPVADESIAATVAALVDRAASRRPQIAAELDGASLGLRFAEGYAPVRVDFGTDAIVVADDEELDVELEISGSLPDITALLSAPLAAGIPKPTNPRGRAALARLADGRVEVHGPKSLGRRVLRLLAL